MGTDAADIEKDMLGKLSELSLEHLTVIHTDLGLSAIPDDKKTQPAPGAKADTTTPQQSRVQCH